MDTHKIDSIVKKVVEESKDYYNDEAAKVKGKIWEHVQSKKQDRPNRILVHSLAAACIILLLTTVFLSFTLMRSKNSEKTLIAQNNDLKDKLAVNSKIIIDESDKSNGAEDYSSDTVYMVKKEIIYQPIERIQRITDTVYVREETDSVKAVSKELLMADENDKVSGSLTADESDHYNTEIEIRNKASVQEKKKKKIRFRFGGERNQSGNNSFTLSAKL